MQTILILGSNGQLGSDLQLIFNQSNLNYIPFKRSDFDCLTDNLENIIGPLKSNIIINCIATTNVDACELNSANAFLINSDFSYRLAMFCNKNQITLFHISTDYIFSGDKNGTYSELDNPNPLNIYGLSKLAGDIAVRNYCNKHYIFRVSSLFGRAGASGKGGNFITTIQRLARERDSISVIANQYTCPTATLDIARAIKYFIINDIQDYGIYNCVSSTSCSWYDFAKQIIMLSNLDLGKLNQADFNTYSFKARRPQNVILSIDKISKYYQMQSWQDSLKEYFFV